MGFSDVQIANCTNINEIEVRALRKKLMVQPVTKQIDTLVLPNGQQKPIIFILPTVGNLMT